VGGTRHWNGVVKVAAGIASVGTVIGLAFAAWFAITGAIAGEAETRQQAVQGIQVQRAQDDVAFEVYKVQQQLDEITIREKEQEGYSSDAVRKELLIRQLDILIRRQAQVIRNLESTTK
jgi:hypothetical protein